jgi:hypothetical protein
MFTTYAVRDSDGVRHRLVVGSFRTQDEAIDMANRAIFDNANYTVVQCPIGATLICLPTPFWCYIPREPEKLHIRAPRPYLPDDE